jgi:uncharacterized repeat protein (TIGR03803 family)
MSRIHDALNVRAVAAMLSGCAPTIGGTSTGLRAGTPVRIAVRKQSEAYNSLYSFVGGADGALPYARLTNVNGVLYGTTGGGASTEGTVYSLTTSGAEPWIAATFAPGGGLARWY